MKITFRAASGEVDKVLHNQSQGQAKRALRLAETFGISVTVQADGDDFSRLCTALKGAMEGLDASIEDVHAFHAPSECVNLVVHDWQRQVNKLVEDFGFTPESFLTELDRRVSPKFVYQWGAFGVEAGDSDQAVCENCGKTFEDYRMRDANGRPLGKKLCYPCDN